MQILKRFINRFSASQEAGLVEIKSSPASEGDVVFVHGLGGDAWNTWRWNEQKDLNRADRNFWLYWLASDSSLQVNVWSFGYDAKKFFLEGGKASPRYDQAKLLLGFLEANSSIGQKPLFFVTHSLGGLVVKEMVRVAEGDDVSLLKQIKGIVFLATPHVGSDLVKLAYTIRIISLNLLGTSISTQELQAHNTELRSLDDWFRGKKASGLGIKVLSFYELYDTWGVKVVEPGSADPKVSFQEETVPVPSDHIHIVKPKPGDSLVCPTVNKFIHKCIQNTSQLPQVNQETKNP